MSHDGQGCPQVKPELGRGPVSFPTGTGTKFVAYLSPSTMLNDKIAIEK